MTVQVEIVVVCCLEYCRNEVSDGGFVHKIKPITQFYAKLI